MTIQEREGTQERDRLVAELLDPPPAADEAGEVDLFLQARAQWQPPYRAPEEPR